MNKGEISQYIRIFVLFFVIFIAFVLFLDLCTYALEFSATSYLSKLITTVNNPFIGFCFGILATAILQSSSTITTLAVVMVASNTITLEYAIPIVFGSNIGTTFTCLIVSVSHYDKSAEFKRATTTAFLHHLFNIICAIIFFSIELGSGLFSNLSYVLGKQLKTAVGSGYFNTVNPIQTILDPVKKLIVLNITSPYILLVVAIIGLYISLRFIVWFFNNHLMDYSSKIFKPTLFQNRYKTFFTGLISTAVVHSSSTTTSLMVPLAATNKISFKGAFNFIIGANVGTTLTALSGAFSKSETAISVAIAHVLFNVIGLIIYFYIPKTLNTTVTIASILARFFEKYRLFFLVYIAIIFFIIPFLLILVY